MYSVLFWVYIIAVVLLVGYDLFHLKEIKISKFIIEMFLVWASAAANMFVLYQLGIDGQKFFLIPDIMLFYLFGGLALQLYGVGKLINKIS